MSRPVYSQDPGRLAFLLLLTVLFFTGILAGTGMGGAGESHGIARKLREVFSGREFPGWEEHRAAFREWFGGAGKKIAGFTGEAKKVLARQARPSTGANIPGKKSIYFPVLFWEKQEFFPDRLGFTLPEKAGVYAAASGFVAELLPVKGGWRVRLEHGGGWSSVYYPLAALTVSHGWQVRAGEKLGSAVVGENGETKLFWEVWRGGEAVSPRSLLMRGPAQETGK